MLMTAAGTIPPAKVLVLGAGVAGLQAIATARRLGAVVEAFDVRSAVKEQVESLGAKFLELEWASTPRREGGYARELTDEEQDKQQQALADEIERAWTSSSRPRSCPAGRAPKLVTAEAVRRMKPGSVIVDLAGEAGGNCELTEPGETVVKDDVTIAAPLNLPSDDGRARLAALRPQRPVAARADDRRRGRRSTLDFEDEIVKGACVTRDGEIVHEGAKSAAEEAAA